MQWSECNDEPSDLSTLVGRKVNMYWRQDSEKIENLSGVKGFEV